MLGVHFAITPAQESLVPDGIGDLEESWAEPALKVDTDKAWDAIDRCLSGAGYPLSHAVLGGRHLTTDYYAVLVTAAEVHDVAAALQPVTEEWLRERYDALDEDDYGVLLDDEDFAYTWSNFEEVRALYERASAAGRAVLFTAT